MTPEFCSANLNLLQDLNQTIGKLEMRLWMSWCRNVRQVTGKRCTKTLVFKPQVYVTKYFSLSSVVISLIFLGT